MKIWYLAKPDYESDYQSSYINGSLEHPFGLPGVECDRCHQTWRGVRVLPLECPESLRTHKHIKDGWPISLEKHRMLQKEVRSQFEKIGISCPNLEPGDDFLPGYLDVPSKPRADFLWAGLRNPVVSLRIKSLFEQGQFGGAIFCSVMLRKIGKRNARLPAPIPTSGEPEDIIAEVPMAGSTDPVGPYFEMLISSKAKADDGTEVLSVCPGCGWETYSDKWREFVFEESMWDGQDIFCHVGAPHRMVTDRLKQALLGLRVTNVEFQPVRGSTL